MTGTHDHPEPAQLLENNRRWAARMLEGDPEYFDRLVGLQAPAYLWIGCSDSRVPANTIVGLQPGEVFVHRNIANVVPHSDLNALSVIQYAVEVLKVRHILVVGHYGCGGVRAALSGSDLGAIDNWLAHIRDVWHAHYDEIMALPEERRADRLVELNVAAQVRNVARTSMVQRAWREGRALSVHGWVYDLADGRLRDLGVGISGPGGLHPAYRHSRAD
jgi:carbonic anhydrase